MKNVENNTDDSFLSKTLKEWTINPELELMAPFVNNAVIVKGSNDAENICNSLVVLKDRLGKSDSEKNYRDIFALSYLFQRVSGQEAAKIIHEKGIPLELEVYNFLLANNDRESKRKGEIFAILKTLAMNNNIKGIKTISKLVNANYECGIYYWLDVFKALSKRSQIATVIVENLNGRFPDSLLGLAYLDMCNSVALNNVDFYHPFNNEEGFEKLKSILASSKGENWGDALSVVISLPFLDSVYADSILNIMDGFSQVEIQIEASWAGASLKKDKYIKKLIDFTKDYRYSSKAVKYARELGLESMSPSSANSPDFKALGEMCDWLSNPNEFGIYPDKAEIYDKRELFWPPTNDKRLLYIIKYIYSKFHIDDSDETGYGLVGSKTFSLSSLGDKMNYTPLEIYAMHCNWEMEKKDFQNIKEGVKTLRLFNGDME